jgi:uncharacterized protein (TIGR02266 family)
MTDSARRDKRFPSKQLLLVRCETWSEFAQLYAADVSRGGMFIMTDDPPPILTEIEVDMRLPEGHAIAFRASIVHVLGREQAEREGRQPGVGVQFVNLNALQKQQILQLVEFARWEGDSPKASYASRMFETATSLPPSKVLEALPPEPVASSRSASRVTGEHATMPAQRSSTRVVAASSQPAAQRSLRAEAIPSRAPDQPAERSSSQNPRANRVDSDRSLRPEEPEPAATPPAPKPLDVIKLKLGMTHLTHKRFDQAIKTFAEVLKETPGDKQATQWFYIAHARLRLKHGDPDGASDHYQKALEADENNHEARKFVREHSTKKRLNSLPFGRYFVKK